MRPSSRSRTVDRPLVATVLFAAVLIAYVSFLLISNYRHQKDIQDHILESLGQETEEMAVAISYFVAERKYDLTTLADSRALSAFYENKALGMSMKYGLLASLLAVHGRFEKMQAKKFTGGAPIYSRLLLVDHRGVPLVDTRRQLPLPNLNSRVGLPPAGTQDLTIRALGSHMAIFLSHRFKGEPMGHIIALVSADAIFANFLAGSNPQSQLTGILTEFGHLFHTGEISPGPVLPHLEEHTPTDEKPVCSFQVPAMQGIDTDMIAVHVRIDQAPLTLFKVLAASKVFSPWSRWGQFAAMVTLAAILLAGAVLLWRMNTQKLILRARLEESSRREAEIQQTNEALRLEMEGRSVVENALKESEARFRGIFNSTHDGVAVYRADPGGDGFVFVDINRTAEHMEKISRADIIGKNLLDVFPGAGDLGLIAVLQRVWDNGMPEQLPLTYYQDEKRVGWRENFVYKLPSGEIVAIYQDKTEDIDAEKEKLNMEKQLRQAQKMEAIGTLAGGIAHDFNNILAAIMGYTEIIAMSVSRSNPIQPELAQILKAAYRARDLIQQILAFSRSSEHEKKPVRLHLVVKEVLQLLRASIPATIDIQQQISAGTAAIMADPVQIHQVVMNLCTNSHHAMAETSGTLRVALSTVEDSEGTGPANSDTGRGGWVKLTVADSGHGMAPETIERIFDPYFTTKERGKGTGLGLAVVHGIVHDHGGSISVKSIPGQGTTIDIFLPPVEDRQPGETKPPPSLPPGDETILYVDDEQALVELGQLMLESLGYSVVACTDPAEALSRFISAPNDIDLVITDMTMPGMTGVDLSRKIRLVRPDLPIIMCTGYHENIDPDRLRDMGIRTLVTKPVRLQSFAETIRGALEGQAGER